MPEYNRIRIVVYCHILKNTALFASPYTRDVWCRWHAMSAMLRQVTDRRTLSDVWCSIKALMYTCLPILPVLYEAPHWPPRRALQLLTWMTGEWCSYWATYRQRIKENSIVDVLLFPWNHANQRLCLHIRLDWLLHKTILFGPSRL